MTDVAARADPVTPGDGRLSAPALAILRGVRRFYACANIVSIEEVPLANSRRADVMAISADGSIEIVEIKSSVADLRADHKWRDYLDYCDRFYFAIDLNTPCERIPADVGLFLADAHGAERLRIAPENRLAAARRKAVTLNFARLAARRLHRLHDPGFNGLMG